MEVCGDSTTQYEESEKCVISFSSKSGDRIFEGSGADCLPVAV
jgi:hypothetical protein